MKKWGMAKLFGIFLFSFGTTWLTISMFSVSAANHSVSRVIDGDTLVLGNGETVRLLGIDAPDKGEEGSEKAAIILESFLKDKRVWAENDRYETDLYGRRLSWIWVNCESEPQFSPSSFMKTKGRLLPATAEENPIGCMKGILINEQIVKMGLAQPYFITGEGRLKYEERIKLLGKETE